MTHRYFLLFLCCFFVSSLFAQTPHITSFSPTAGTTGTIVRINGSGFTGVDAVTFGGDAAASFIVASDSLITAHVGPGASGVVAVYKSTGYDSLPGFVFVPRKDTPLILSISPDSGSTGTVVGIRGVNFTGTTAVRFGGTPATTFQVLTNTFIRATVGSGASGFVTVTTVTGSTIGPRFTYIPPAATHITSFSPTSGTTGTTVSIHGVSFTGTSFVSFGGVRASSFTVSGDTLISAVVGTGASGAVVVSGTRGSDSLGGFTYTPPVVDTPQILVFMPYRASTGTVVNITGHHFTGVTAVSFGGTPAASFTVVNDTAINATVGSGSSGYLAVTNAAGTDSVPGFIYIPAAGPTHITSFSPDSGTTGTTVQISGVSFTGATVVSFGGVRAQSFAVVNDSLISAVVGSGASGQVFVAAPSGSDSLAGFVFVDSTGSTDSTGSSDSTHALAASLLKEYPNPVVGVLYVTLPGTTPASKLLVTDMNGAVLRTIYIAPNATTVRVNVSGLVKGVYKLVWSDGKHRAYQTVLVLNE